MMFGTAPNRNKPHGLYYGVYETPKPRGRQPGKSTAKKTVTEPDTTAKDMTKLTPQETAEAPAASRDPPAPLGPQARRRRASTATTSAAAPSTRPDVASTTGRVAEADESDRVAPSAASPSSWPSSPA